MKEIIEENQLFLDHGMDECCNIAESMIEEIHQIAARECSISPYAIARSRDSLKKKIIHQIKEARKMAMI